MVRVFIYFYILIPLFSSDNVIFTCIIVSKMRKILYVVHIYG